jgi:hypothetical protein
MFPVHRFEHHLTIGVAIEDECGRMTKGLVESRTARAMWRSSSRRAKRAPSMPPPTAPLLTMSVVPEGKGLAIGRTNG